MSLEADRPALAEDTVVRLASRLNCRALPDVAAQLAMTPSARADTALSMIIVDTTRRVCHEEIGLTPTSFIATPVMLVAALTPRYNPPT